MNIKAYKTIHVHVTLDVGIYEIVGVLNIMNLATL